MICVLRELIGVPIDANLALDAIVRSSRISSSNGTTKGACNPYLGL